MKNDQGLIKWIVLIIIALIVLGYFGFDIKKAVEAPTTQSNLTYVQQLVSNVWHNYLKTPATYLWGIFIKYIWEPALHNLLRIGNNEPTIMQEAAPKVVDVTSNN